LSPDGTVTASLDFNELGGWTDIKEISLIKLVEGLLEPHRLSMEEIKASDLDTLLRSLEASIHLVNTAMAALNARGESAVT
jgi:hypothetical protein